MLEFLKECKIYNLAEKAEDIECSLRNLNCISTIQSFFEVAFKVILIELGTKLSSNQIERLKYFEIVKNQEVIDFCKYTLNFEVDEYKLDKLSDGNKGKHSPFKKEKEKYLIIKEHFKYVFMFSRSLYKYYTKKEAPKWSDETFYKTYDACTSPLQRIQMNEKYSKDIELANKTIEQNSRELKHQQGITLEYQIKLDNIKNNSVDSKEHQKAINEIACQKQELELLEEELQKSQKREKELEEQINKTKETKELIEQKLYTTTNKYERLQIEYENGNKEIATLKQENTDLRKNNDFPPKCQNCNSYLELREKDGELFWGCRNWKKDKKCEGTRKLTDKEKHLLDYENKINEAIKKTQSRTYKIEPIKKANQSEIVYDHYPVMHNDNIITNHMFDSLLIDKEIFDMHFENELSFFSKFFLSTNLKPKKIDSKEKTIYSIALRMLNRGAILPLSKRQGEILKERFNIKGKGNLKTLNQFVEYVEPYLSYKSQSEKEFAEFYFPKYFGKSWASFVLTNVNISMIIPDDYNEQKSHLLKSTVSFYIVNNGIKHVIFIKNNNETIPTDLINYLKFHNVNVIVINQTDIRNEEKINNLLKVFVKSKYFHFVDFDEKYLIATKLFNQLQISILKSLEKGYILSSSNICLIGKNTIFTNDELEFIFNFAIEEIKLIISNLSKIYGLDIKLNFDDYEKETVEIHIGDGKINSHSILIRDCYVDYHFLCNLEPFDPSLLPQEANEKSLTFFLELIFGYDSFRQGQLTAIERLLLRKDSIILLPTGAGKSIIYQLCSFLVPGLIVVVSPLISLIEDQVANLNYKHGITTSIPLFYAKTQSQKEKIKSNLSILQNNTTSLIYLSPERLQTPSFRNSIKELKYSNTIFSVAIDEAHCVSEWGHDFRAAYLNVANVARSILSNNNIIPNIIALTGTASDAVLNDVKRDLEIYDEDAIISPPSFDREELKFSIYECYASNKIPMIASIIKNKIPEKLSIDFPTFIKREAGCNTCSGIVFTPNATSKKHNNPYSAMYVKQELSDRLPELGINCYFSKVPEQYDEQTWSDTIADAAKSFKENKLNLLVATKAFGMGIDKENIRYTIHDGIPQSIEQYYQEAGRAGRDRKRSECILVFSNDHEKENDELLNPALTLSELRSRYDEIACYNSKKDDIIANLYFHTSSFEGIKEEMKYILELIEKVKVVGMFENGNQINISIKKENEKHFLRAIIRFVILGIINDYTYDYRGNFSITMGSFEKQDIIQKYEDYVSGYSLGRIEAEKKKINNLTSEGWQLVQDSCEILINYIYENIEQSRRRAIKTIYDMAKAAVKKPPKEQDSFIRTQILNYLSVKQADKDFISSITESSVEMGYEIINNYIYLYNKKIDISKKQIKNSNKLKLAIERQLESLPDHPVLLYLLAVNQLIGYKNGSDTNLSIANNIIAGYKYSISRYSVNESKAKEILFGMCNLMLQTSISVFDKFLEQLSLEKINISCILEELLDQDYLQERSSDYLLLLYANKLIDSL